MSNFCSNCGEKLKSENALVCVACGAGQAQPPKGEWSSGTKQALFVLTVLFPFIGFFAGLVGIFNDANRAEGLKLIVASFVFWIIWSFIFLAFAFV